MIQHVVAIAGSAAVVCAPAAWADTLYLGGTGQRGEPTYDGPRPGKPATPQSLNNVRVKPGESRSGLNGIRSSLNQVRSSLRQLGENRSSRRQQPPEQNEQPSAASSVAEGDDDD